MQYFPKLRPGLASPSRELREKVLSLISELLTLEARPTRSGQTYIGANSGAKDDRASVIAALMDSTAPATRMTRDAVASWRELINDVRSPGGAASRFGDVIGVPGLPNFGLDQLDRL